MTWFLLTQLAMAAAMALTFAGLLAIFVRAATVRVEDLDDEATSTPDTLAIADSEGGETD